MKKVEYFKEFAHTVGGSAKSEICRVGQQAGDPERVDVQTQVQGLIQRGSVFYSVPVFN